MGSTTVRVSYRPLRIGFLVPEGAIELAVEAAKINSLLWGGMNNPIIPVGNDPDQVKGLIDTFSIDTIFCLDESIDLDRFYDTYSQIRHHQMVGYLDFRKEAWQSHGDDPHCLDILSALNHVWGERTHAWPPEKEGRHAQICWSRDDPEHAVFALLFGAFPREESVFEQRFKKVLHSSTISLSSHEVIPDEVIDKRPPISFTSYLLRYDAYESRSTSLYLGRASNFRDLVTFWNLRAAGVPVFFCNIDNMDRWASVGQACLRRFGRGVGKAEGQQIGLTAYCDGLGESKIDVFRQSLNGGAKLHIHDLGKHKAARTDFCVEPITPFLQEETVLAVVEDRESDYRMSCPLPAPTFLDTNDLRASTQHFVAIFSPTTEFEYPLHTIKVPFLRDLAEDFGRTLFVSPFESTMQSDGVGRIISRLRQTINIRPVAYSALVNSVLGRSGIHAEPSQPGVLVMAMLQQLGGMHDAWVFKVRGVRKLIKAFRADECFDKQVAKTYICDQGTYKKYKLFVDPNRTRPDALFDHLLEKGLLRPGLDFKCGNCRLSNWLPLDRIREAWTCEYCGENQRTAVFLSDSKKGRWRFRKSGLLGKDNNQEGAIPVLLSLLVFESLFTEPGMVWAPGLKLTRGEEINCEVDLCILQYARHEQASWSLQSKLEVGIGECKDEGGEITDQDIHNMISIYKQVNRKEIRCYLICSKTADNFTPAELNRFKALKNDRIPLILLTNSELEAYYPYMDAGKDASPPPTTLQTMSWISDRKYLAGV